MIHSGKGLIPRGGLFHLRLSAHALLFLLLSCSVAPTQANSAAGTVVSWGLHVFPSLPAGTRFEKIASGGFHNLALKGDGTVVAWGSNEHGQSLTPGNLEGVVALAAGWAHSLALKSDGAVVA